MKISHLLILLLVVSYSNYSKAQLTANAGNDTIVCEYDTLQLGNFPSAYGGSPPYTYAWETSYTIGANTFYASTFLNDTTISNPLLITHLSNLETLTFKLTITDSLLNVAIDSITITFSQFFSLLVDNFITINQGDSVQLTHTTYGGIPPLTFTWFPNYHLSDSTDEYPWANPDTTTYYNCILVDAAGCQTINSDVYEVYVNPVYMEDYEINTKINIFPIPSKSELTMEYINGFSNNLSIEIYDTNGKIELTKELNQLRGLLLNKVTIYTKEIPAGIHLILIKDEEKVIATKKWVKTE